jgi:hypothetical protein
MWLYSRKSQIADFTDRFDGHLCSAEKFTDSGNNCGRFLSHALNHKTEQYLELNGTMRTSTQEQQLVDF